MFSMMQSFVHIGAQETHAGPSFVCNDQQVASINVEAI